MCVCFFIQPITYVITYYLPRYLGHELILVVHLDKGQKK